MKNVVVTGGCGFLGRRVVAHLRESGHVVTVIDNLDRHCGAEAAGELEFIDVTDGARLFGCVEDVKADAIIHLAAYGRNLTCEDHPYQAWRVNVSGTLNVLEVAERLNLRAVICSSNIVLSDQNTVYKRTKQDCEWLVDLYARRGVSCMALRPSNIYGPGQSQNEYQLCAFAALDKAYAETGKFLISGDGTQRRDWVHVDDVARAFEWAAMACTGAGTTLDVCTGRLTSMNEIAAMLHVPVEYTEARKGDAKELVSDPEPLRGHCEPQIRLEERIWDAFPSVPR